MGKEFLPEQNHTAKPNCMLSVNYFDDSGPDRINITVRMIDHNLYNVIYGLI